MIVADLVRRQAAARPTAAAYSCRDGSVSWAEVDDRSSRLAQLLLGAGLATGDRVAMMSRNCHRYWEVHFACAKAGLVAVPVNHRLIARELGAILADSGARAVIASAAHAATVSAATEGLAERPILVGFDAGHDLAVDYEVEIARQGAEDPRRAVAPSSANVVAYTSGTTGRPKGAVLSHHGAVLSALAYAAHLDMRDDDRILGCMPAYVMRGGSGFLGPAVVGAQTVMMDFDAAAVLDEIRRRGITWTMFAPAMVTLLLRAAGSDRPHLPTLRRVWTGGAPLRPEMLEGLVALVGDVVGSVYGMTEATGIAVIRHRLTGPGADPGRMLAAGRPMPLLEVSLRDPSGHEVAAGAAGEIWVRGDTVMDGYWRDPERTAQVLRDGWFATGDIARRDSEGFLFIVDRTVDVINSGGINVYPSEVEAALGAHPEVLECAVIGVPDATWGELVAAVVVPVAGVDRLDTGALAAHCRERLAGYKTPRRFEVVGALPRNALGKVDRRALREPHWAGQSRRVSG